MVVVDNNQNAADNGNSSNDADNGDDIDEEDVFLKIERNDPNLTHLEVKQTSEGYRFHEGLPPADDWEELGRAVGNNTNVRSISFRTERKLNFLLGFLLSIQRLNILGWYLTDSNTFDNLIKFFCSNKNLECLRWRIALVYPTLISFCRRLVL